MFIQTPFGLRLDSLLHAAPHDARSPARPRPRTLANQRALSSWFSRHEISPGFLSLAATACIAECLTQIQDAKSGF